MEAVTESGWNALPSIVAWCRTEGSHQISKFQQKCGMGPGNVPLRSTFLLAGAFCNANSASRFRALDMALLKSLVVLSAWSLVEGLAPGDCAFVGIYGDDDDFALVLMEDVDGESIFWLRDLLLMPTFTLTTGLPPSTTWVTPRRDRFWEGRTSRQTMHPSWHLWPSAPSRALPSLQQCCAASFWSLDQWLANCRAWWC